MQSFAYAVITILAYFKTKRKTTCTELHASSVRRASIETCPLGVNAFSMKEG